MYSEYLLSANWLLVEQKNIINDRFEELLVHKCLSVIYLFCGFVGYGEKQCTSVFWNGELGSELRELGNLDFFGLMKENDNREKVMEEVDKVRGKSVYTHSADDCSDACKTQGKDCSCI